MSEALLTCVERIAWLESWVIASSLSLELVAGRGAGVLLHSLVHEEPGHNCAKHKLVHFVASRGAGVLLHSLVHEESSHNCAKLILVQFVASRGAGMLLHSLVHEEPSHNCAKPLLVQYCGRQRHCYSHEWGKKIRFTNWWEFRHKNHIVSSIKIMTSRQKADVRNQDKPTQCERFPMSVFGSLKGCTHEKVCWSPWAGWRRPRWRPCSPPPSCCCCCCCCCCC